MTALKTTTTGNITIWHCPQYCHQLALPEPQPNWFNCRELNKELSITGSAEGRGTTWFMEYEETALVLRHYKRGGLVAKLSDDAFLFFSYAATRPYQELRLLSSMKTWQLPVPTPVAGQVIRSGYVWRGDLICARIPNASDVHSLLLEQSLSTSIWRHIGATIKRFHDHQVFHHDLNIHNIMLDNNEQAWLIDFDKCAVRRGQGWKQQNLLRLQRSLHKEYSKHANYHFEQTAWQALMTGYTS